MLTNIGFQETGYTGYKVQNKSVTAQKLINNEGQRIGYRVTLI